MKRGGEGWTEGAWPVAWSMHEALLQKLLRQHRLMPQMHIKSLQIAISPARRLAPALFTGDGPKEAKAKVCERGVRNKAAPVRLGPGGD